LSIAFVIFIYFIEILVAFFASLYFYKPDGGFRGTGF
jgi:hypothetical protein